MKSNCWVCGVVAETAEHRLKKSDITESYGKGPYNGDNTLIHVKDGVGRKLQGPDSKLIKFEKNLCKKCNNQLTQPFDFAYQQFVRWFAENKTMVLNRRSISLHDVFGKSWKKSSLSLYAYFAKAIGCRINEVNQNVPEDIVNFITKASYSGNLVVSMLVNEDKLILPPEAHDVGVFALLRREAGVIGAKPAYFSGIFYGWLTINIYYNCAPSNKSELWDIESPEVSLSGYWPLSEEQREDLNDRLRIL